jgi:hypothetical protein
VEVKGAGVTDVECTNPFNVFNAKGDITVYAKWFNESILSDFNYVKNADGTYTLNEWSQTLNGMSSTEMVFPDSKLIIM